MDFIYSNKSQLYDLVGGGVKNSQLNLFLLTLSIAVVRIFLIFYSYNLVVPKLRKSLANLDESSFTKLNLNDAILVYILSTSLFPTIF